MSDETVVPPSDQELIDTIKQRGPGIQQAWKTLISRHQKIVSKIAWKFYPHDEAQQDDLAQKTWEKVFTSVDTFRGDAKFSTWLHTIARNMAINEIRKHTTADDELIDDIPETDESNGHMECMGEAWIAFQKKSPDCFNILQLYYKIGYNWREVGEQIGKSESAVKEQGSQCVKKFKPLALDMCGNE